MKYLILILLALSFVSAGCVDINSASLDELDEIVWVGPATAQKIIDARPFDSVEDLEKVSGIGEVKISDIKEEGLACVDGSEGEENEEEVEEFEEEKEEVEKVIEKNLNEEVVLLEKPKEIISLGNNIEKEIVYESKNSKIMNYLPYAFSAFLITLVGVLLWERF